MRTFVALITTLFLIGCATETPLSSHGSAETSDTGVVTYYDRNSDGRVDYELHDFGCCDRNWALVDTDFSGRYDLELRWGYSYAERPTDSPIPTWVSISAGDPFRISLYPFGSDIYLEPGQGL